MCKPVTFFRLLCSEYITPEKKTVLNYLKEQIIRQIQKGQDSPALTKLYQYEYPKILHFIKTNQGDEEEAKDIFQDAILIFYKQVKLNKFDLQYDIGAYIYSISRNLWINRVKKKSRHVSISEHEPVVEVQGNVLDDLITEERENIVKEILSQMGSACQQLLRYVIYFRLSMKEIAKKMKFSSENVAKTKHYKCKQRLIKIIKEHPSLLKELKYVS